MDIQIRNWGVYMKMNKRPSLWRSRRPARPPRTAGSGAPFVNIMLACITVGPRCYELQRATDDRRIG